MDITGTYKRCYSKKYSWMLFLFLVKGFVPCLAVAQSPQQQYMQLQQRLATGWHTYNHQNILSHVLMPEGLAVTVGFKAHNIVAYGFLGDSYVSAKVDRPEKITPISYSADGSYRSLLVEWQGMKWSVQSSADGSDLNILVTPIVSAKPATLFPLLLQTNLSSIKPA
jgi:hypothetical protein